MKMTTIFPSLKKYTFVEYKVLKLKLRLPKIALKWMPKQKTAPERPKKNWMEGIRKAMKERNLNEGQREDRKQWSLGAEQRRKAF